MLTVPQVIDMVYGPGRGSAAKCADQLRVQRSAVSNWKTFGKFPARWVPLILTHAKGRGLELELEEIPSSAEQPSEAAQ